MLYHFETVAELNKLSTDFVSTDLDVALSFAQIARQTEQGEYALRSRHNARKGYDAVLQYMRTANLTPFVKENIAPKLASLKAALLRLGEAL